MPRPTRPPSSPPEDGAPPAADGVRGSLFVHELTEVRPGTALDYLAGTLGVPFLVGRSFQSDGGRTEQGVVLSESAARQLWPDRNSVGRSIRLGATVEALPDSTDRSAGGPAYPVIGVVRDTRGVEFDGSGSRQVYLELLQPYVKSKTVAERVP